MKSEDFQTLTQVGKALWSQPGHCRRAAVETLTAVSMLEITSERAIEKATEALLEKANRDGAEANESVLDHPFYRMIPEERLVLGALHLAHWSYRRLARILSVEEGQIETLAWSARLRLASFANTSRPLYYPNGSKNPGTHCPEYNPAAPWTQKFLDEEMPARERMFLQNHLMVCEGCRKALGTGRELYFRVDSMLPIPRSVGGDETLSEMAKTLERVWTRSYRLSRESLPSLRTAVEQFVARPKIFWVMLAAVGVVTYLFVR